MGGGIFAAYGVSLSYSVVSFNAIYSLSSETSAMALGGSIFSGTYVTLDHSDIEQGRTYAFYGLCARRRNLFGRTDHYPLLPSVR